MQILFITSSRVGDAILTTGILKYLADRYHTAKFTIACGPVAKGLFDNVPGLEEVITMRKDSLLGHWRRLYFSTFSKRWDLVVDLRGSAIAWFLPTKKRLIYKKKNKKIHRIEDMQSIFKSNTPYPPHIWLGKGNKKFAQNILGDRKGQPLIVIGPTANWSAKIWEAKNFSELVQLLTKKFTSLESAMVAVVGGPGEESIAKPILDEIPPAQKIDLVGAIPFLDVAAVMEKAALYVGNDSGLMHLSAAVGAPTLGLFGPTCEENYRPWGPRCGYVRTIESYEQLSRHPDFRPDPTNSLMSGLSVETVLKACGNLLDETRSR